MITIRKNHAILYILIFIVCFRGIIDNYIGYGTLILDYIVVVLIIKILNKLRFVAYSPYAKYINLYFAILLLATFLLVLHVLIGMTDIYRGILGLRNDFIYIIPFVYCLLYVDSKDIIHLDSYFVKIGFIVCVFGIIQYLGRSVLPKNLLTLKAENAFTLIGYNVIRVNALLGNTIIFSGFCVFYLSLIWARLLTTTGKRTLLLVHLITAMIANILTFSRASFVAMIIVIIVEYLMSVPRQNFFRTLFRILVLMIVGYSVYKITILRYQDTALIQRLTDSNSHMNMNSDSTHLMMIMNAIEYIKSSPVIGYGVGKAGYSAVTGFNLVTDGSFWTYLVEYGIPLCLLFLVLILSILIVSFRAIYRKNCFVQYYGLGLFSGNIALLAMSIINSAYSARAVLVMIWIYSAFVLIESQEQSEANDDTRLHRIHS